jgi:hypothetical protein
VPANFSQRGLEIDGGAIRVGIIPRLAKLHIKLQDAKHAQDSTQEDFIARS